MDESKKTNLVLDRDWTTPRMISRTNVNRMATYQLVNKNTRSNNYCRSSSLTALNTIPHGVDYYYDDVATDERGDAPMLYASMLTIADEHWLLC